MRTLETFERETLRNATRSPLHALDATLLVQSKAEDMLAELINRGAALRAGLEGMRSSPESWRDEFMAQVAMFTKDVEDVYRRALSLRMMIRYDGIAETGNRLDDEEIEQAGGEVLLSDDPGEILASEQVRNALRLLAGPEPELLTFGEARVVFGGDAVDRIEAYRSRVAGR